MRSEIITDQDRPSLPISAAARLLGISVHTVRMYERAGLIVPYQKKSNHRLYSRSDIERIRCIRRAINEDKISIAGLQRILALIPCWDVANCSNADRENCEAFRNHTRACWTFDHPDNGCSARDCRACPVYRESIDCASVKNRIIGITEKYESTI